MPKTAAGKKIDEKELRAKAVAGLTKHIEAYETAGAQSVGHWINVPKEMQDWHFIRFNNSVPQHREVAAMLLQQGYIDLKTAAPQVRIIGFESDGENRLYLGCPPEVKVWHKREKERKRKQRFQLMVKDFGGHLSGVGGDVEIKSRIS